MDRRWRWLLVICTLVPSIAHADWGAPLLPDAFGRAALGPRSPALAWRDGAAQRSARYLPSEGLALPPGTRLVAMDGDHGPAFALVGRGAVVKLDTTDESGGRALLEAMGLRPLRPLMLAAGLWLVDSADENAAEDGLQLAVRLASRVSSSGLLRAVPDLRIPHKLFAAAGTPNDPLYAGQWYFASLDMPKAWSLESGSAATTIVVVDTGCDLHHPDLASKIDPGKDVITGNEDASPVPNTPGNGHGTSCAGIIGAATNNNVGIAGACPACRLRCVRLLSTSGEAVPMSADVDAYEFARSVNAAVVSNSWGFTTRIPAPGPLSDAITTLHDQGRDGHGTLVLFAAGNDDREIGDEELLAIPGITTIGAINRLDEPTQYTNYGDAVDLVAYTGTATTDISGPDGEDPGDYTTSFGGTSSACPVAAGIAGLLVSAAPKKTAADLEKVLIQSARPAPLAQPDKNGHDPVFGFGIVDPVKALVALGAGATPDAGEAPSTGSSAGGCGCAAAGVGPGGAFAFAAIAMLAARLRRRVRAPRGSRPS